ncbi:unnamed protein product, partial [marine sediment metagenome]
IGQGKEEARKFLKENRDVAANIEKALLAALQEQKPSNAERARKSA